MKMKRVLCVILSFVLLFSLLFVTVYADEEGNGEISETTAAVQEETTTEAVVQAPPLPEIFTVKLDYGGHGENKELAVPAYEKIVNKPEAPFLEGSVFDGWYIDNGDGTRTIWDFDNRTVDGNITLYAVWTEAREEPAAGTDTEEPVEQPNESVAEEPEEPAADTLPEPSNDGTTAPSTQQPADPSTEAATKPSAQAPTEPESAAEGPTETQTTLEYPEFNQSQRVNDVFISVYAPEGIFPAGARLQVISVPSEQVEEVIEEEREPDVNVAVSYTFDIKVVDANGEEIQPADGEKVKVSFRLAEVADENLDTAVYHIEEEEDHTLTAQSLDVDTVGQTAVVETDGFSLYTVEFTYDNLEYVLPGDESVALATVLTKVGLTGEVEDVSVSNKELFSVSKETGEWIVYSHKAFSSAEWMKVLISGMEYEITVTDDQEHSHNDISFQAWSNSDGLPVESGCYYLTCPVTMSDSWNVQNGIIICLNGYTITNSSEHESISILPTGNLSIYDCNGRGELIGGWINNKGTLSLYGGTIKSLEDSDTTQNTPDPTPYDHCTIYNSIGTLSISGGKVEGYVGSETDINLSGSVNVEGISLFREDSNSMLHIIGRLDEECRIAVRPFVRSGNENVVNPGVFTKGLAGKGNVSNFSSLVPGYKVVLNNSGEAELVEMTKITTSQNDPDGGTVTGGGTYEPGDPVTCTATPNEGYVFEKWVWGDQESHKATIQFNADGNRDMKAFFWKVSISDIEGDHVYNGEPFEPKALTPDNPNGFKVELIGVDGTSSNAVIEPKDYDISYNNNINAGEAEVILTFKDKWTGVAKKTFTITPADISTATVKVSDQQYNGASLKPVPTVTWKGIELETDTDFTLSYDKNVDVGTAKVTVTGANNFSKDTSVSGTFNITPKPATIKVNNASKQAGAKDPSFTGSVTGLVKPEDLGKIEYYRTNTDEETGTYQDVLTAAYTTNNNYTVTVEKGDFTITAHYKVTEGEGSEYKQGSDGTLTFVFMRTDNDETTFDHFTGVKYDGKLLTRDKHYTASKGSVKVELLNSFLRTQAAGDHTLTAMFDDGDDVNVSFKVLKADTYTVLFHNNGHGTAPASQKVAAGSKATKPTNPTASGYTFGGWYTEKECLNAFDFNTPITNDITLYAKWTAASSGGGSSGGSGRSVPGTGDTNHTVLWAALMVIAILMIGGAIIACRKRRSH